MKDFLSNSWVVSIISGILVFFITNFFIIIKNKNKSKKQLYDANMNVLNHIRGYVVDNGLPKQEIIESVKNSVAREYNVKCANLLSTKEICEELVKDIIGNIYISNESKKSYIKMLEDYLEQNKSISDSNKSDNYKSEEEPYNFISTIISLIASFATVLGISLSEYLINMSESIITIIIVIVVFAIVGAIMMILYLKKRNNK